MKEMTGEQLRERLEAGEPLSVVDVREASEYDGWHILGSDNIPVYDDLRRNRAERLVAEAAKLPKDRAVVAVCRAGVVSRSAAAVLESLGYESYSLAGGMRGWGAVWSEARIENRLPGDACFLQIRRVGKGCLSYFVGSAGEAAVVDPSAEVTAYTAIAEREGMNITHVLETHVHADHLSRARALCAETGATLVMAPNDRVQFPFTAMADGATLPIGDLTIGVIASPGHTGESVCYRIDKEVLLTGDTLFLDSVGRPDLEKGDAGAEAGARALYASLRRLVDGSLDEAWFYPCHHGRPIEFNSRPLEGRIAGLSDDLELLGADEEKFVAKILRSLQEKPPNFEDVLSVNEGRAPLGPRSPLDLEAGPNRCAAG